MILMGSKLNVLIVDPDKDARELTIEAIRSLGGEFTIAEADDVGRASSKMNLLRFDLVVLEMNLGKQDGLGFLQTIATMNARGRPNVILVFTERAYTSQWKTYYAKLRYQKKPCSLEDLRKTLFEITHEENPESRKLNEAILLNVKVAAGSVLPITAGVQFTEGDLYERGFDQKSGDISALCELKGQNIKGSFAIVFTRESLSHAIKKMYPEEFTEIPEQLNDLVAELASQIMGIIRRKLNAQGMKIESVLPSLTVEVGHQVRHATRGTVLVKSLKTDGGPIYIESCIRRAG